MKFQLLLLLLLGFTSWISARPHLVQMESRGAQYTAAVVEYHPIEGLPNNMLAKNVEQYEQITTELKTQGADIVVFPEYGLTSTLPSVNRMLARDFSQVIPDAASQVTPCDTYNDTREYESIRRLSCLSRNQSIYLVVNILEREECSSCSDDQLLLYNTNVAFDRSGVVVARYRKFNLFGETALNTTAEPDIAYFDADFGVRFGLITCFDLLFETPGYTLVQSYNVTDVIVPTAWGQELPFLIAVQAQAGWSYSVDINLLASGYNYPSLGNTGSGIYGGLRNGALSTIISDKQETKALISTIPGTPSIKPIVDVSTYDLVIKRDNLENFTSIELKNSFDPQDISECHEGLCCQISYQFDSQEPLIHYHLVVYDGIAKHASGTYTNRLQVCGLVACSGMNTTSCSDHFNSSTYSLNVQFNTLKLEATYFKSNRVWPNTLLANTMSPIEINNFNFIKRFDGENQFYYKLELNTALKGVHTFGLFSEDFEPYVSENGYLSEPVQQ